MLTSDPQQVQVNATGANESQEKTELAIQGERLSQSNTKLVTVAVSGMISRFPPRVEMADRATTTTSELRINLN